MIGAAVVSLACIIAYVPISTIASTSQPPTINNKSIAAIDSSETVDNNGVHTVIDIAIDENMLTSGGKPTPNPFTKVLIHQFTFEQVCDEFGCYDNQVDLLDIGVPQLTSDPVNFTASNDLNSA